MAHIKGNHPKSPQKLGYAFSNKLLNICQKQKKTLLNTSMLPFATIRTQGIGSILPSVYMDPLVQHGRTLDRKEIKLQAFLDTDASTPYLN